MNIVSFLEINLRSLPIIEGESHAQTFVLVRPCVCAALPVSSANAQNYPIMDKVVQKVVQKYQTSSCEQLAAEKSQPPTGKKAQIQIEQ